jgi:hypothetical protein
MGLFLGILSIILFFIQWGLQLLGVTTNIFLGWILLIAAYVLAVISFFTWRRPLTGWTWLFRAIVVVVVGTLYFGLINYYGIAPQKQQTFDKKRKEIDEKSGGISKTPQSKNIPTQRDYIEITAFASKNQIVLYNPGERKVFVSHLSLRSEEHSYSGIIYIYESVESKKFVVHSLKTTTGDFSKFGTRSFTEDFWKKFLLKWRLNENECIRWEFYIPADPGYKNIKTWHGDDFHAVPIDATLYFGRRRDTEQDSQRINVFAVPFVNLTGTCGVILQE